MLSNLTRASQFMKRSVLIQVAPMERAWGPRLTAVHLNLVQLIVPFRLVNYSNTAWQLSSYIPLASATFIYVGCGRAIYTLDLSKTAMAPGRFGNQVEVLVCNYGPVDRTASQLYTLGRPGLCPLGTFLSDRYPSLCSKYKFSCYENSKLSFFIKDKQISAEGNKKVNALENRWEIWII